MVCLVNISIFLKVDCVWLPHPTTTAHRVGIFRREVPDTPTNDQPLTLLDKIDAIVKSAITTSPNGTPVWDLLHKWFQTVLIIQGKFSDSDKIVADVVANGEASKLIKWANLKNSNQVASPASKQRDNNQGKQYTLPQPTIN